MRSIHLQFFILNLNQKTLYKRLLIHKNIECWLQIYFLGFYFTAIDLWKLVKLLVVSKEEILLWFIGPNPWKASLICV